MSADIVQHWDATNQTTVSNEFRKVDLSDGSPAIAGDVIIFGGICSSAGTEIALATSTLQTSGNAILTTIDADTGNIATSAASIDGKITACNTGAVVVSSSALPSGAATAAKQPALGTAGTASADVITVQGRTGMTALVVDGSAVTQPISGSVTANIGTVGTLATAANQTTGNTSLATLAGAVAGAEMQVDILTMPNVTIAGTVTVAGAVTNAGTFAVQVDGAALTSLQLLDDSVGTVGAAIVSKGLAAVGTDGTNARIIKTDTSGELQVDVLTMPTVAVTGTFWQATQPVSAASLPLPSGAATLAEQQTQTTSLQLIDDAVNAANGTAALSKAVVIAGVDSNDTGNVKAIQISPDGFIYVAPGAGNYVVEGTAAHDSTSLGNPVVVGARASAAAPADVSADNDRTYLWALRNGAQAVNQTFAGVLATTGNGASGTGVQRVTIANDSTGILAGVTTVTTCSTVTTVSTLTGSGVAHDGADSGNPHKIGARATNVDIAAVSATNDRTDLVATMTGKLITHPFSNPENAVSGTTSAMTGTTSTSLISAPGAGLRNYITQITVSNSHATVGTDVIIQDGSGGTTLYTIPAAAVYGGALVTLPFPLRQPTANTALFCANVTTGSSTKVSASGFKAA